MTPFTRLCALATLLALGGCILYTPTTYHTRDPFQFLGYQASRGEVPVMVVGTPFPRARLEALTVDALDRNFESFGNPFRAVPPGQFTGGAVVVLFDPSPEPVALTACKAPGAVKSASDGLTMRIGVIYCNGGPLSEAWVALDRPASADSPVLRHVMERLVHWAIPRKPEPDPSDDEPVLPNT